MRPNCTPQPSRSARSLRYTIERLEPRRLLTGQIIGTGGNDSFIISVDGSNQISLIFNGVPEPVSPAPDGQMEVDGFGGNDTITLLNSGTLTWFLNGSIGNDQYVVGNGHLTGDIRRNVFIEDALGGGIDTTIINDLSSDGTTFYVDDSSVAILSLTSPFIALPTTSEAGEGVTVRGGSGDDTLMVLNLGPAENGGIPPNTYFDLGGGNDMAFLGGSQKIVATDLPSNATIDAGSGGGDVVVIDDSNPSSTRNSISLDQSGLIGGPQLKNFVGGSVLTHQLAGNAPETVTFSGTVSPFASIKVFGCIGDDFVQFGEPGHPITSQGYWGTVLLELSTGLDTVNIFELSSASAASWTLQDEGLARSTESVSFSAHNVVNGTIVPEFMDLNIYGTNNGDSFTYVDAPDTWNVSMNGMGGNDIFQEAANKDLDAVFDGGRCIFDGGAGIDTIDLNDSQDAIGDADVYDFETDRIYKSDFGSNSTDFFVEFSSIDQLNLVCDDDPNIIHYETGFLAVLDIDGRGGNDTFLNRSASTGKKNFAFDLGPLVRLHGGNGNDVLSLDDTDGSAGSYTINTGQMLYSGAGHSDTLNFDSMATVELFGSNFANTATLAAKPTGATLNVNTNDGDDTIAIGGGDLNSTGLFTNSGVTVSGGVGNDRIVFDDHLVNTGSTYTFGNLTLTKGASTFVYSTFEFQTLKPADVFSLQFNLFNTINLNSISSFLSNTTIIGGTQIPCNFNIGNGDLVNVSGSVDIQLGVAGGNVSFDDQNHTANRTYVLTPTAMTSPQPMSFSGASAVILNGGSGADTVTVTGTPAGTALVAHGNNGNDTFQIGGGNFANLAGNDTITGDVGNDTVQYLDTSASSHDSATLNSTALLSGGRTHAFATVEHLGITMGSGGSDVSLDSIVILSTITGGVGDDVVNFGNGSLNTNFLANLQYDGGAGTDTMSLLGQNDSAKNTYAFPAFNQFRFGDTSTGKFVTFSGLEQGTLQCGSGGDTIDVTTVPFALSIFAGDGSDNVTISASTAPVTVNTGSEDPPIFGGRLGDSLSVGFVSGFPATVLVQQDDTVVNLSVIAGSTLRIDAGAVLKRVLASFIDFGLGFGGTIDLAGGALLYGATSNMPDFRSFLTRGYNGGAWNGASTSGAINSSLAAGSILFDGIGYGSGSQIAPTTIGSYPVGPDDVLLRYTLNGDADLNNTVNAKDLGILSANWQGTPKVFSQADFNYDNKVDVMDLYGLGMNFNQAVSPAAPISLPIAAEPTRAPRRTAVRVVELIDA